MPLKDEAQYQIDQPPPLLPDQVIHLLYRDYLDMPTYKWQQDMCRMFLSKRTVDKHRENLLLKTGSNNTASLVIYAIKNSIIQI